MEREREYKNIFGYGFLRRNLFLLFIVKVKCHDDQEEEGREQETSKRKLYRGKLPHVALGI